ncbi:MAG: signal recognition particle-docking protein FtsY, partial [Clostridiales bacterium]|nr:signal recognition particle-docking protein FtsY [Clostridiales bacterium]
TTGQNAIAQARAFGESAGLTGIILTKLDGTAKGGVAVAVKEELKIPVRFVGVGEGIDDMQAFDPDDYARALLSE